MSLPETTPDNVDDLEVFLERRDLIAHAAERLRADTSDQFAVSLLMRFEKADAATTTPLSDPRKQAARESLRRVVAQLLAHHTGIPATDLATELVTLTALTAPVSAVSTPTPRRRTLRLVTAITATGLLGVAVGAVLMFPDLNQARRDLAKAERDVEKLEERVAQVANEKARAQDDKEYAAAAAEQLAEIATFAASITNDLELCIQYGNEVTQLFIDISKGYRYSDRELDRFFDEWSEVCGRARSDAAALRDYVNGQ